MKEGTTTADSRGGTLVLRERGYFKLVVDALMIVMLSFAGKSLGYWVWIILAIFTIMWLMSVRDFSRAYLKVGDDFMEIRKNFRTGYRRVDFSEIERLEFNGHGLALVMIARLRGAQKPLKIPLGDVPTRQQQRLIEHMHRYFDFEYV
ncbi:MAG: hypothetical protein D6806_16955 [Deltaproteobacteria bacterium]|nr:MAG: hypothetical protein D6806_16955 [Deltaproteobacteria bacterium]